MRTLHQFKARTYRRSEVSACEWYRTSSCTISIDFGRELPAEIGENRIDWLNAQGILLTERNVRGMPSLVVGPIPAVYFL